MNVLGYEFPHLKHKPYDADWLKISIKAKHPRGDWSKISPCLLTWELADLAEWIESIADKNPRSSDIEFLEPELSFRWIGDDRKILRVYLDYGLRPFWSPFHGPNEEQELFVEFNLASQDLRKVATSLRNELKRFPVRVGMFSR